jgi:hypothetical protein
VDAGFAVARDAVMSELIGCGESELSRRVRMVKTDWHRRCGPPPDEVLDEIREGAPCSI